jgi:hypothetical protein
VILGLSWFGGRRLLRMVEESFWSLNSLAVQPAYVLVRELLRHFAEKLLPAKVNVRRREALRARMAAVAGLVIFIPVAAVVVLAWPKTQARNIRRTRFNAPAHPHCRRQHFCRHGELLRLCCARMGRV